MGENTQAKQLKRAGTITVIIIFSKLIGFVREAVIAAYFGIGPVATAYTYSSAMLAYFSLFFTTAVSAAFMPIYTKIRAQKGHEEANTYTNNVLNFFIIVAIILTIVAYIFAPQLSALMWQGDSPESPQIIAMMTQYSRMMFPSLVFLAMTGVLCNVCNANERFVPEQLQGFALSLCVVVAAVFSGSGKSLAIATAVAGIVHFIWVVPFLRGIFDYKPKLNIHSQDLQRTFIIAFPALLTLCFDEINGIVSRVIASTISDQAGMIQNNSYRILMLIQGILIVPIITVMFPQMSKTVARNDRKGMVRSVRQSTEILAMVTLPIVALVCVLNTELVGVLFQRGKFTANATQAVATALVFYIVGLFGFGLRNFETRAFFAMQKNKIPLLVGVGTVVIDVVLSIVLSRTNGVSGLLLASSIAASTGAVVMMVILRKILGPMGIRRMLTQIGKIILAALICLVVTFGIRWIFPLQGDSFIDRILRMSAAGIVGLIAYAFALFVLKVKGMFLLLQAIMKRSDKKESVE